MTNELQAGGACIPSGLYVALPFVFSQLAIHTALLMSFVRHIQKAANDIYVCACCGAVPRYEQVRDDNRRERGRSLHLMEFYDLTVSIQY